MTYLDALTDLALAMTPAVMYYAGALPYRAAVILYAGGILAALFTLQRRGEAIHDELQ